MQPINNKLMYRYLAVLTICSTAAPHIWRTLFDNFAIGIQTFFQKIADPRDIAPSMAVEFTINHIAAVVLPALGGLLWMIDYRITFISGAILCGMSLILVQSIPGQLKKKEQPCSSR